MTVIVLQRCTYFLCRYSLQGDTKKYFSIGKYSGELKTVHALDREENSTYTMEVIAVDGRMIAFINFSTIINLKMFKMVITVYVLICGFLKILSSV